MLSMFGLHLKVNTLKKDEEFYTRGINSIQLLNDQKRWWVMNVYWNKETEEFPLPKKYCN